jgi:hypothetical protein
MAYCTLDQVETLMGITFGPTSRPADADVDDMISRVAAEIDGVAQSAGYDVPVGAPEAMTMLASYNAYGVAAAAWHAGFISDAPQPRVDFWERTYTSFLQRLKAGTQQLPGAPRQSELEIGFAVAPVFRRDNYWSRWYDNEVTQS